MEVEGWTDRVVQEQEDWRDMNQTQKDVHSLCHSAGSIANF